MKKTLLAVLLVLSLVVLSACTGTKYSTDKVSVIFFTANFGSTPVEGYYDLEPNQLIEEPEEPIRQGFVFNGWYKDFKNTEVWDFDVDQVEDESIVIFAGWIPDESAIIYDLNGGTMITQDYPESYFTGDSMVLPLPSRPGFSFVAWYTYDWVDESSTIPGDAGYQTLPEEIYTDLYLYAHWAPVKVRVTFRANYPVADEGPDNPSSLMIGYGNIIDFDGLDDTAEYAFLGWNSRSDGSGTAYINGEVFTRTQRTTVYAVWELIE